jgi:hypothetical protein
MTIAMGRARGDDGSATATVLVVLAVLALLFIPFLLVAGSAGQSTAASACTPGGTSQPRPSATAQTSIPASYLALFEQTGLKYGIPWPVLAAIGDVESGVLRHAALPADTTVPWWDGRQLRFEFA